MGYEQPSLLLQSENPAHHVRMADLPVLKRSQDYRFFQQLLLLDEEAIYSMHVWVRKQLSTLNCFTDYPFLPLVKYEQLTNGE